MYRVLLVDDDAHILSTNRAYLKKQGYQVVTAASGAEALAVAASAALDAMVLDVEMPGLDGVEVCRRIREVSGVPILFLSAYADTDDRIRGLLAGGDDYLAKPYSLQELELRLRLRILRRENTERREVLGHLIHDVKNPLTALRNYAELVRMGNVALDQETAGYLDALNERAETVEERLVLLQGFSRGERGMLPLQPICLNDFLRMFYEDNRPDMELSGQEFLLELPRASLTVAGDEERLRSALENLCYNALSFTPEDGSVTLALREEGDKAVISVTDTGAGIEPADLPHVFERGFTHRPDGSGEGMGLFIVHTIALEHGGTVEAQSQVGKGSTFTLRLPLA